MIHKLLSRHNVLLSNDNNRVYGLENSLFDGNTKFRHTTDENSLASKKGLSPALITLGILLSFNIFQCDCDDGKMR
ncbi:MAG: hypothetical protein RR513_03500 [Muribaculaceae bacterium]